MTFFWFTKENSHISQKTGVSIRIMILKQTTVKHRNGPPSLLTPTENLNGSKAIFTLTATASLRVPKTTLRFDDLLGLPKLSESRLCSWSVYYIEGIEIKIGQRKGCTWKHPGGFCPRSFQVPSPREVMGSAPSETTCDNV